MFGVLQFKMEFRPTGSGYTKNDTSEVKEELILDFLFMTQW